MFVGHVLTALVALFAVGKLATNARAHLPMLCLVLALGLLHGLIPLLTPEDLQTVRATAESRVWSAWYAFCGVLAFVAGYDFHASSRDTNTEGDLVSSLKSPGNTTLLRGVFWATIALSLLGVFLTIRSAGVGLLDFARASRFEYRFEQDQVLMWTGGYLFHLAFAPGFLAHFLPRCERIVGLVFCVLMTGVAFFVLFKGTRHVALGILGASVFGYAFATTLDLGRVLKIGLVGGVLAFAAVSLYEVRKELNYLSVGEVLAKTVSLDTLQEPLARDPLNYHEHLIGAIDYFPAEHPYLNGATYRRMLTFYLPGSSFPILKPELPGRVFASVVYGDIYSDHLNAVHPPSLLGDAYINFWGWPGLAALFLNGVAVSWITQRVFSDLTWFCGVGPHFAWFTILGPRGNPYDYFVMAIVMMVMTWGLLQLVRQAFGPGSVRHGGREGTPRAFVGASR